MRFPYCDISKHMYNVPIVTYGKDILYSFFKKSITNHPRKKMSLFTRLDYTTEMFCRILKYDPRPLIEPVLLLY